MMEWEDTPSLSWKEIERMERNREKAKRLRRIKIQRRALLLKLSRKKHERMEVTPPTASLLFSPGEENAAHLNLDSLLEPKRKNSRTQSAIMD